MSEQYEASARTKAVNAFIDGTLLVAVNAQPDDTAYDLRNALNDVMARYYDESFVGSLVRHRAVVARRR